MPEVTKDPFDLSFFRGRFSDEEWRKEIREVEDKFLNGFGEMPVIGTYAQGIHAIVYLTRGDFSGATDKAISLVRTAIAKGAIKKGLQNRSARLRRRFMKRES